MGCLGEAAAASLTIDLQRNVRTEASLFDIKHTKHLVSFLPHALLASTALEDPWWGESIGSTRLRLFVCKAEFEAVVVTVEKQLCAWGRPDVSESRIGSVSLATAAGLYRGNAPLRRGTVLSPIHSVLLQPVRVQYCT